jgi:putative ABC transport system substrate-binding protein
MRFNHLRRREFITLLGGAAAAWPLAATAQQQPTMLRVGVVTIQQRESPIYVAFDQRLRDLGYREARISPSCSSTPVPKSMVSARP